ncbi:polyamine aminopropyltransferase [Candidatus Tachikawaea gelatinosa]|uniref:Polyamine aminopropyltransferase n=1 Tax=Candidatus Tachikawaea gelatinosa TaxID=1410383 RepID=A0A090BWF4_9ENTR|nr:polyamine aminopropyltransferase [Candidatus Tachikawaea gelatinosa]BAP58511.1 spermidine synthase [Candidatus Tachikawaea gelatinosa]
MILNNIWYESLYSNFGQYFKINKKIYSKKTKYQDLLIFENENFGRVMTLNGIVQTTESDEFIYHEMMTHVPLLAHGEVKKVLIFGGGDGGIVREVLRYECIKKIFMVEIDIDVIKASQKYLPKHNLGAYKDKRLNIIIDDGLNFLKTSSEKFDVIISDCTDPIGPGKNLFTYDFYMGCKKLLKENGIFIAQNGVCFLQYDESVSSYAILKKIFQDVRFYQAAIPSYYGGNMNFIWATDNIMLKKISALTLKKRLDFFKLHCLYYNHNIHINSFCLPQYFFKMLSDIS